MCFVYPVAAILARTFTDVDEGVFENVEWFLSNDTQVAVLVRTFQTGALVTAVCLLVGYPYAYLLTVVGRRVQLLLLAVVVVSLWQSILARNYAWRILLRDEGVVNEGLAAVGVGPLEMLGTTAAVVVGMAHVLAPFMILPLYAALRTIDPELLLAARTLGARPATAFLRIVVPLSLPGVLAGCLVVFVISLGFFITPALLGSPQNSLLSQAIAMQVSRTLDWGHAGAMSLVLLITTVTLIGISTLVLRRRLTLAHAGSRAG